MRLYKYAVKYHDGVIWNWVTLNIIAENETQLREYINKNVCNPEFRTRYAEDSLMIKETEEITIPYEISNENLTFI